MLAILFKKYFTYVSMAQSLALNAIGGFVFSPLFIIGVMFFVNRRYWYGSGIENIVPACKVMVVIIFGFIVENGIMYLLCKSIRRAPIEFVDEKKWIRQGIIVFIVFLCAVFSLSIWFLLVGEILY